jgi:hypothetical protein
MNNANEATLRREEKQTKKIAKIMRRSIFAAGIGIGLFFLKFLVIPMLGLEDNEAAVKIISSFSLYLIFYGVALTLVFIFKRSFVLKANLIMNYVIVPLIAVKMLTDLM